MDDDPDPRLQRLEALRLRSEENAADVAAFDARCLYVAQQCVDLWHRLWLDTPVAVAIDSSLEIKFRVCFPLAAHALNHVDTALSLHQQRPWVAASCTRVAFEHALAAQWVLLTDGGERELVNSIKGQHHKRGKELTDALSRLASEPGASALLIGELQPQLLVGGRTGCERLVRCQCLQQVLRHQALLRYLPKPVPSRAPITGSHLDPPGSDSGRRPGQPQRGWGAEPLRRSPAGSSAIRSMVPLRP
jgi:hypothetical protein